MLEGFQSGLSWLTILRKREAFRAAFAGFEIEAVARFGKRDVRRLLADAAIVRHRGKIEAAIANAKAAAALDVRRSPSWSGPTRPARPARARPARSATCRATTPESTALSKELKRRGFRFVGPTTAYAAMQACGIVNDHLAGLLGARRGRARAARGAATILTRGMDERALAERLITYDTSTLDGMKSAAGFVKGWLEARDVEVAGSMHNGRPVLAATVGPAEGPTIVLHGHLDVVPARPEQFSPRVEGDRLYGRGAYDMKGGLASMMLRRPRPGRARSAVRVHFVCVADEESEEVEQRGSDYLVEQGYIGDFAITGEPTDLHIGIQAKGVLAMRIEVSGTAAHGSTPWAGDNAVLKAIDVFRQIEALPFARESSDLFDRPSINLGRIVGGDALNKVPDLCVIDVDVRYLPGQDPEEIRAAVDALPDARVVKVFHRHPAIVDRENPYVQALGEAIGRIAPPPGEQLSVGRDGASDAISFLEAGVPAVECGPTGAGHHGPDEWVSVRSLGEYRQALVEFVNLLPARLGKDERPLRIA